MTRLLLAGAVLLALIAPADASRPVHCPKRAWCGCYLASYLGKNDRSLWLASNWARVGSAATGPAVGVVTVWRHHVGIITGRDYKGNWVVRSGNDGRRVRERVRPLGRVIALRWP